MAMHRVRLEKKWSPKLAIPLTWDRVKVARHFLKELNGPVLHCWSFIDQFAELLEWHKTQSPQAEEEFKKLVNKPFHFNMKQSSTFLGLAWHLRSSTSRTQTMKTHFTRGNARSCLFDICDAVTPERCANNRLKTVTLIATGLKMERRSTRRTLTLKDIKTATLMFLPNGM
jgi:hypothetical protein